jgi:hypothetical protein
MAEPLKQPCGPCGGVGIVPHEKRRMENGVTDPSDFRVHEICLTCGGSGKVPFDKTSVVEKGAGFIADHI